MLAMPCNSQCWLSVEMTHWPLMQGPKDGVIIFKNAMGAILGEGPVQAVSVGHVGFSVTLDAKSSAVGLVAGTNTDAYLRRWHSRTHCTILILGNAVFVPSLSSTS